MSYFFVQTFHFLSLFPSPQCIPRHPGRFSFCFGGGAPASKARQKRAEDEVDFSHSMQYGINVW